MSDADPPRPRFLRAAAWAILALCIPVTCAVDYMGKFSMLNRGRDIARELDAEASRRGVQCREDWVTLVPADAEGHEEGQARYRFLASLSFLSSEGPALEAEARLNRIEPSVFWLESVQEGEAIRLRFRCSKKQVRWCIETQGVTRRFHGGLLRDCPARPNESPITASR